MNPNQREQRVQTLCQLILSGFVIAFALRFLKPMLIPFVLAAFIAIGLTPIVNFQVHRFRFPRPVAVVVSLLLAVVVLGVMGLLISISVSQFVGNADVYQDRMIAIFNDVTAALPLEKVGLEKEDVSSLPSKIGLDTIRNLIMGTTTAVLGVMSDGMLVVLFLFFMLFGGSMLAEKSVGTMAEVQKSMRQYLVAKVVLSLITGVLTGLTLWMLDVPLALAFGLMAFLLNFIPSVGSIIATLLPLPMALVIPDVTGLQIAMVLVIPGAIQFVIGNIIEPKMMGKSFGLHPIVVLMALIFWGMLWNVPGMFLAVPLTAVLKIIFDKSQLMAPLGSLLEGNVENMKADDNELGKG